MNEKEHFKNLYFQLKIDIGKQPSSKLFFKKYVNSRRKLDKLFGREAWSKFVTYCGDTSHNFMTPKTSLYDILLQWGNLVRNSNMQFPTEADWNFNQCKPTIKAIRETHKIKWSELPYKFNECFCNDPDWNDVVKLIPQKNEKLIVIQPSLQPNAIGVPNIFLPPIISNLCELAISEDRHNEFEKKVNLVFQMLGFEIEEKGQGTGRNPDGIAKDNQNRYSIIIDSKERNKGLKFTTEDRQIIEYINKYRDILNKNGYKIIYFLIVSSSFETISKTGIENILKETNTITSFITAKQLLILLAKKIEFPMLFDLKEMQKLFVEPGEISDEKINKFLSKIKRR